MESLKESKSFIHKRERNLIINSFTTRKEYSMMKRIITIATILLAFGYTNNAFATYDVIFQVHMGVQMQLGNFDPATDSVVVQGDFQTMVGDTANWYGTMFLLTDTNNDSIYTITITFPDSSVNHDIQYKFGIEHNGSSALEQGSNRTYTITSDPTQTLPVVYYSNLSNPVTVHITFQADLTELINEGFTPGTDSMEVMGDTPPLTWTPPGAVLTQEISPPTLFTTILQFTGQPGTPLNWKFHGDPANHFTNGGWEDGDNHIITFPSADTTLDMVAPNMHITTPTGDSNMVYFRVDMNGAHERFHNTLITGLKSVWIGGSALPLQWPSQWLFSDTGNTLIKMYDDGTHSDSTAGDMVYSNMLVFPSGTPGFVQFKYGAVFDGVDTLNGGASYLDNEAGFSLNHGLTLNLTGGTVYRYNMFGDQATSVELQPSNTIPSVYTLGQNYPNPFNPSTKIEYAVPKSSLISLKIYNILGQEVATIFRGYQNTGKYLATFNASNLASGIYFYRLQAGNVSLTKKMILMK
jgi:Secretion system C-terminal sorting domain